MKITTKIECDTQGLLSFMVPGLELSVKLIQEQIDMIKKVTNGHSSESDPEPQVSKSLVTIASTGRFQCQKCSTDYATLALLHRHERAVHKIYKYGPRKKRR